MNHLGNIIKKELREMLSPGTIISLVMMIVILGSIGSVAAGEASEAAKLSPMGLINNDTGTYGESSVVYIKTCYIDGGVSPSMIDSYVVDLGHITDKNAILSAMKEKGLKLAMVIGSDYSSNITAGKQGDIARYYVMGNDGMMAAAKTQVGSVVLGFLNAKLSADLIKANMSDPEKYPVTFLQNPITYKQNSTIVGDKICEDASPIELGSAMMNQSMMIPVVMMMIIVMIGSIVISSMGNEKENKTLETLLTMPVKRITLVSGKLIASAMVGVVFGMTYLVGMMSMMSGMMSMGGKINLSDYGLELTTYDWLLVGLTVFLSIMTALGICMIMGAFVKNNKSAQTMTLPISVLAMIPMFITMFSGWDGTSSLIQTIVFAIPFSHPMMAANNLIFGNSLLVLSGIVYLAIFTLITVIVTVKIYNSDVLITGLNLKKNAKNDEKRT